MRITVPEGKTALIIDKQLASKLLAMAKIIRGPKRNVRKHLDDMYPVAGDLIIAIVEAGE